MRNLTKLTAYLVAFIMVISTVSFTVFAESSEDILSVANTLTAEMLTTDNEPECSVTKNLNLDITEDLTLPDGVTVTFKSSNEDIIAEDGTVKRNPSVAKDVTLTATISQSGSESVTKDLKFTVLPLSSEVISSDNAYYPSLKDSEIVTPNGTAYTPVNPKWSLTTLTNSFVTNILSANYSKAEDGTYNVTSTRKNLNNVYPADGYVKYSDSQIPNIVQSASDKCISVKINFNPVDFGTTTGAKQLYLRLNGAAGSSERMLAYVQFWPNRTRLVTADANQTELAASTKYLIKPGENNTLEMKIDYIKKEYFLYLNGNLINTTGIALSSALSSASRKFDCVHFGYLRTMENSVLQINDITVTRETSYKVYSVNDITPEIIADGQNPAFITNNLDLPANSDITWESSNAEVISDDGAVIRPITEDAVVTMTASEGEITKEFEFTVKAQTATAVAVNKSFAEPFFGQVDKGDECSLFTQNESAKTTYGYADGEYFAQFISASDGESAFSADTTSFLIGSSGKYIFEFDAAYNNENNAMVKIQSDGKTAICMNNIGGDIKISNSAEDEWNGSDNKTYGTVDKDEWNKYRIVINTLSDVPCASIYMNGTLLAEDVALLNSSFESAISFVLCAKGASEAAPTEVNLDNFVLYTESASGDIASLSNDSKARFIARLITYNTITDGKTYDLESDLDLESALSGYNLEDLGVKVEWTSSQPDVISVEGKVTRAENNRYVVMTVNVTAGTGEDAVTVTKEFPFTVAAADSSIFSTFEETFENYEPGAVAGWTAGQNSICTVEETDLRDGRILKAEFTTASSYARKNTKSGGSLDKRYFVSMDVYFSPDDKNTKQYVEILGPGNTARVGFDFKNGTVSVAEANGDRLHAMRHMKIEANKWYHIDIDLNVARKNFMAYINGVAVEDEYVDIIDTAWAGWLYVRSVGVYSYGTGKAYMDNVVIRQSNSPAPVYDENRDYTIRSVALVSSGGYTISNPAPTSTSVKAKVKVIKNRTPKEGESKVIFARYDENGKLQQIVSEKINTQAPGYETNGQILNVEMPLTGDCSNHTFKIYVMSGNLNPYEVELNSTSPIFDTERLFNKPANATLASELGYDISSTYDNIDAIFYDGDTYKGRPVKHFAYIGLPEGASAENPVPAVVCVHGGGGTAFEEWVKKWNEKGYAAIAMDHRGGIPILGTSYSSQPLHAWSSATQDNYGNVSPYDSGWMYGAVTSVIAAHNVLREMPEIDNSKIGVAGISWGGVITSTVIGVDDRFAFAIPSYGCGFLYQSETWMADHMTSTKLRWEPSNFIDDAKLPILWMNGDSDVAFSITSTTKSSLLAGDNSYTAIIPGYNHGESQTWNRTEPYAFADSIVRGGTEFIRGTAEQNGNTATVKTNRAAVKSTLRYMTVDKLHFEDGRTATYTVSTVTTTDANTDTFTFTLPSDATMFYVTFTDENGNNTSTVLYDVKK